jgi:hypothetical protein
MDLGRLHVINLGATSSHDVIALLTFRQEANIIVIGRQMLVLLRGSIV